MDYLKRARELSEQLIKDRRHIEAVYGDFLFPEKNNVRPPLT